MASLHIHLGLFLTIITRILSKTNSPEDEKIKGGISGFVAGNHFFIVKVDLPPLPKTLKYTFVLVKHGMAVPEVRRARTYPNDPIYKDKWEPGATTQRGRSLMLMVGRSLKTRYHDVLKDLSSFEELKVSSITSEHAIKLTVQLGYGLLRDSKIKKKMSRDHVLDWIMTDQDYEKMEKLLPVSDNCIWLKILYNTFEMEITAGTVHFATCTPNLYASLREHIPIESQDDSEWYIDSPGKVYKLWSLLVFEILQGQKEPDWARDKWPRIQSCVFEYYRNLLAYHPAIPALATGRILHEMERELNEGKQKFHIHVTNDIGAMSLNWTLPNSQRDYWPDPADSLIFDFYSDDTVQVSSFSGWQRSYDVIYEGTREDFFQHYKNKNIHISERDWSSVCAYDGKSAPPRNASNSKLYSQIPRPEEREETMKGEKSNNNGKTAGENETRDPYADIANEPFL